MPKPSAPSEPEGKILWYRPAPISALFADLGKGPAVAFHVAHLFRGENFPPPPPASYFFSRCHPGPARRHCGGRGAFRADEGSAVTFVAGCRTLGAFEGVVLANIHPSICEGGAFLFRDARASPIPYTTAILKFFSQIATLPSGPAPAG